MIIMSQFRSGRTVKDKNQIYLPILQLFLLMERPAPLAYQPQHFFNYPFTLVSHPKRTFISQPIDQPTAYELYCPISCKKIKSGAIKGKNKEGLEFNTTSSRWISTVINQNIRYLINRHPPNKKDKKKAEGNGWSFWVQVLDKGNSAIFNPYCTVLDNPLSLYTFSQPPKIEKQTPFEQTFVELNQSQSQAIIINEATIYLTQGQSGTYIGTNKFFDDSLAGKITLLHPLDKLKGLKIDIDTAIRTVADNKNYWLAQLRKLITVEQTGQVLESIEFNLDQVYYRLSIYLNLQEQIRAKLFNNVGADKLNEKFGYHPRLYSAFNRLASFINYGNTKYNTRQLSQLGFYNKSDMLQDLAYFQQPELPIPTAEDPSFKSERDLRRKLFPFCRLQRGLPLPNIPLQTTISSLLHQTVSSKPLLHWQVHDNYLMCVDQDLNFSLWSCRLFPVKLFEINLNSEDSKQKTNILFEENEMIKQMTNVEKEESSLVSLFQQVPPPVKEAPPVEIIPDQSMLETMQQMGYGIGLIKKALVAVKNQSIPAALDVIEQLTAEQKKKKSQKQRKDWGCPVCTFMNKSNSDTCEMCGELCQVVDEGEKQKQRLQVEAQLQAERKLEEERLRIQKQKEELKLQQQEKERARLQAIKQKQELLKRSELKAVKLMLHSSSPLDPFFVLLLFWNQETQKSLLKIMRIGVDRAFFSKFYRIQEKNLISNTRRTVLPLTLAAFQTVARESLEQMQWGIRLIEPATSNDWIISGLKQLELPKKITVLSKIHHNTFALVSEQCQLNYAIITKDDLKGADFDITEVELLHEVVEQKPLFKHTKDQVDTTVQLKVGEELQLDENVSEVQVEIVEHIPAGEWKNHEALSSGLKVQTKQQGEVVMNQFLPLTIEHFEGSVFSGKHYSTTILQKSPNLYISNYPATNFTFRHNGGKQMLIEAVVVVSTNKRLQRIFSVFEGLIFTANELSWFHIAKERFGKFTKQDYENWLTTKRTRNDHRDFWEPVGFFQIENEAQIELDYKRSARYVFLLPTTVKNPGEKKKDEVYAIKLDFFGVKGRIEQEKTVESFVNQFKNEGKSNCDVTLLTTTAEGLQEPINPTQLIVKRMGNVNTFFFLPTNTSFYEKVPVSTSTVFSLKIRSSNAKKILKVSSSFAQKVTVRVSKQSTEDVVDSNTIKSFEELVRVQNDFTAPQVKKIAESLDLRELLGLLLQSEKNCNNYETLINKLDDSLQFKESLFEGMLQIIPQLCSEEIPATETGFKFFFAVYEKSLPTHLERGFQANIEAFKRITQYVAQHRNKNYNLLRLKYNIEELLLEPCLFSKDYYRLVYPNYVQEENRPAISSEPSGTVNNCMWIEQITPSSYHQYVDLQETRWVDNIRLYVPKITTNNFRPKLGINIWKISDDGDQLLYSRYFHEELIVQLGVNGFKDNQIYKGERLNYLIVNDIHTEARILRIEVTFLLLTTQPHSKYKDVQQKYYLIPLVQSKETFKQVSVSKQLKTLQTTFPQQPKHFYCLERLPPAKFYSQGVHSIFHIYEFPVVEMAAVKREYKEMVQRITTNIMDETIVRESIKQIKISNYEFNRKGLDFAYTYLILLMNLNKKFPNQLHAAVDLMLALFDTFVVYEAGPISKKTFVFLQETYKRLTNLQRVTFVDALINKYLLTIEQLPLLKVSEKYSPLKVMQKLQLFELPVASLFQKLQQSEQKTLKLILVRLISSAIKAHGLGHLELYNIETGKYTAQSSLYHLILSAFKVCLWILDHVQGIKEQAITESLDLLLLLLLDDNSPYVTQNRPQAVKQFMSQFDEQQVWKLVFLTLKLKSESLKQRINKLFTVLTQNLTEKFRRSINQMLQQIIVKQAGSIYVQINSGLSDQLWMNHLQTTLELITMTKDKLFLDNQIALKLLELPLTPTLWSLALHIIPRNDQILVSIIKNFRREYYNSLGKQITKFCEPLAGIRSLQSIHINWLDLVRKIRLEGKNIFELFMQELSASSFGGRQGLTMATVADVKQLQITSEFINLVLEEKNLKREYFSECNIRKLIVWYFLNKSKEKGASPATEKILFLSQSVKQLFLKMNQFPEIVRLCIKSVLQIREESHVIERNFEEKRVPIHSALTLNKRFSECFEEILGVFMTTDELCSYFAFELKGLQHILKTMDIANSQEQIHSIACLPDEELLLNQKLIMSKASVEEVPTEVKDLDDLKEEEFATNVKLMTNFNQAGLSASNADWTVYKKGNKTKIIFLPLIDATYHEHPLFLQLTKTLEVRSIKIGFPAASYEFNDKLVATPSAVVVEGSLDGINFEPIGEMDYLQDDAYNVNGVQVWVLNCQKIRGVKSIGESVKELCLHKLHYLKVIVKRPVVSFIEGQFSQLNGRCYNVLGCTISFLSVTGDDSEKLPYALLESCKQISKRSSLSILASLLNESNSETMRSIANDTAFAELVQSHFQKLKEYMGKYPDIMPGIIYLIGAGNRQLGDWIVAYFLREGGGELEARIINQIITSTADKAFPRLQLFLASIFRQLTTISEEAQIESGLLYTRSIHFLESFCKTLEQCYEMGLAPGQLICSQADINHIISIYDSKHSSPQIKSLVKLTIYLLHIREPLSLSQALTVSAMDLIWQNCSELKTHFYNLMAGLLIDRKARVWIQDNSYAKVDQLIDIIYATIANSQWRNLRLQLFLLSQISYLEAAYLRSKSVHLQLYHKLKTVTHQDQEIVDSVLKIVRNVVLGHQDEEERVAKVLFDDVPLLVKRRDPFLQKLFVGILGLESQVMIHISGLDLSSSTKKEPGIGSKFLTRKQQKSLLQRMNRKCKYQLIGEVVGPMKIDHQALFLKAFSCPMLMVMRFKIQETLYTCGVYSPVPCKRNSQGDYFWEEVISYDKQGFIFFLNQPETLFVTNAPETMLGNIYGGDQEQENAAVFYDEGDDIMQFTFSNDSTMPKLTLTKYNKSLPEEITASALEQDHEGYSLVGIEFWQLKTPNVVNVSDSKISNLLSKSNHAKPPFSYYRHAPIYIFPATLTLSKFMDMLGIKGTCQSKGIALTPEQPLAELEKQSNDFIIDLDILTQESKEEKEEINQIGYIPVMTIFNHFSRLQGVNEVLRLGADSIKDWKKADRKKNFEHYMDELQSFINLPNFFNLFIKDQQYVTLLFEVASGMPDDESSPKNWEEEYVNNFRFIYKIVSDIFKYDRSPVLRDMDKYADFAEVILQKLSEISKEAPRILKEEEVVEEQELGIAPLARIKSEDRKRKKKGIGYGADNQNNSKWSANEWLQARKNVSQETLRVISIMVSFLDCQERLRDERLSQIIKQSCLLPLLESALRSGSLLDISKESELFRSYLQIVRLLSSHPSTIECLLDIQKRYKPEQSQSILSLLHKLNGIAEIFTECLKSGKEQAASNQTAEGIALDIQRTHTVVEKAVSNLRKRGKGITIKELNSMPVAEAYRLLLGGLRFGYVSLKEGASFKHAHSTSITNTTPPTSKILRLSQQLADLSSSLPCEHTNSIFVRCDKSRIDVINVLIMGSKDTPYSNGAFTFDVYCDDSYPNNPPKMLITTTGQGKIRFNPNLYSCGKVCLSLLGTWRGSASENWDPKVSTLLQLFISTQGITMSEDIYFNEPGFEGEQGTEQGQRKNEAYSNIVRLGNVRYAMNGQIKNPPKGFEDVVRRHFYIKRKEIVEECEKWLQYAEKREASYNGLVNDHNSSWCSELKQSKTKYKQLLAKEIQELRELLDNLPPPDLKEHQQEKQDFTSNKEAKEKQEVKTEQLKLEEVDVGYDKEQKEVKQYEQHIMHDRWSRYIGAMGLEAVKKQASSSVLLIGLKPLGLEIAKNLVLSGLKRLTIFDEDIITGHEQHFYMSNLKGSKISDCLFKIKELNPYMLVDHVQAIPDVSHYSVVISTLPYLQSHEISLLCRESKVKFIYAETKGVSGIYFADLGLHTINDNNGEEPFEGIIKSISCEEEGLVTLLEGMKHPYQDGDYVVFSKVEGMEQVEQKMEQKSAEQLFFQHESSEKVDGINNRVFKIKVINWNSFLIGDTRGFGPYKSNGLFRNIKIPQQMQFETLETCEKSFAKYLDSNLGIYDFEKMGDNYSVFLAFQTLSKFHRTHKTYPKNWCLKDADDFLKLLDEQIKVLDLSEEDSKKVLEFGKSFPLVSEAELPTIGAYLGGIVSQEAIKAITNKYTPIRQFFTFHLKEMEQTAPETPEEFQKLYISPEEPFRSLKIVVGKTGADKIEHLKSFIIGAGAIGCELLKNFAMINMGAQGQIVVTDPDHIETSNLSRQFLFREKHVKKAKSATACATLLQLNPRLEGHIIAKLDKVCEETEDTYSKEFFKSRTIVANALDNVIARQYVDKRCVQNRVPLFESGTLGPKGHVQVIVPFKTENYGSQNDPSQEAQIPHCTLKMFPEETVHCIEWARDIFGKIFTLNPKALKKVIEAKTINALQGQQRETVSKIIKYRPEFFDDCIAEAVRKFYVYFRDNVRQLLFTYPIGMITKDGKPFWQLPKRPPKQINALDSNDVSQSTFIAAYAVLLAKTFSIPFPKDFRKEEGKQKIMEIAIKVKIQEFIPSEETSKQIEKEVEKEQNIVQKEPIKEQQKPIIVEAKIIEEVELTSDVLQLKIVPEQFEKDEDSNGHIDLIFAMSNLRCRNYGLNQCTWIQAKLKAGKIMAALSTTTSVIAALQTIEIIKLAVGCQIWRNAFINLAVPIAQISEPGPAMKHKIGNTQFSVWQDWSIKCSTLGDLLTQLKDKYQVQGYNVSTNEGQPVYWQAMYKDKEESRKALLDSKLKDMFKQDHIELHIAMRNPLTGVNYENVPRVKVQTI